MSAISIPLRTLRFQRAYTKLDTWSDQTLWRFCAVLLFVVVAGLAYIWVHVQVVGLGYDINALGRMKARLVADSQALGVDVSLLKSPERLEKIAKEDLNLSFPKRAQFVYLGSQAGESLAWVEK